MLISRFFANRGHDLIERGSQVERSSVSTRHLELPGQRWRHRVVAFVRRREAQIAQSAGASWEPMGAARTPAPPGPAPFRSNSGAGRQRERARLSRATGRFSVALWLGAPLRRLRIQSLPKGHPEPAQVAAPSQYPVTPKAGAAMVPGGGSTWSWLGAEKSRGDARSPSLPSGLPPADFQPSGSRLSLDTLNTVSPKPQAPCGNVQKWVPGNPNRRSNLSKAYSSWVK